MPSSFLQLVDQLAHLALPSGESIDAGQTRERSRAPPRLIILELRRRASLALQNHLFLGSQWIGRVMASPDRPLTFEQM
jgi:hypothetical protein